MTFRKNLGRIEKKKYRYRHYKSMNDQIYLCMKDKSDNHITSSS